MAVILQENLISCYFGSCTFIDDICNSVIPNKCISNPEIIILFYSSYSMIPNKCILNPKIIVFSYSSYSMIDRLYNF